MYRVDPGYWVPRVLLSGSYDCLTCFLPLEAGSAFGVFRWFQVAHFNDFFFVAILSYLFVLFVVG